ncbi:peptidoglycan-binding protein [Nitrosomonas aestuarii]|uniref:peptidoglycan-binding protein n=1 Tax=Nitrosomonas aestuarii TaxID=52441 RepID=UPI000D3070F5|nr:peptidoglycan-binding protein [Nitrosomonas aestuarii]PTN11440.1 putative chitinase [Nitrosomonas aestuarii]
MIPVNSDFILAVAPRFSGAKAEAQSRIVGEISAVFSPTLDSYDINTKKRIAHFMAQVTHECAGFRTTEEFASGAAYEGREDLGNIHAGDGKRYKGRGLIQLTGRTNYRKIGEILDLPLEDDPVLAAEPVTSLKIACEYWNTRKINAAADRDDLIKATKLVNGGLNGLDDRRQYLQKAKTALANIEGIRVALNEGGNSIVLRRGSFGDAVRELQELLIAEGFDISIDNDFGPATELAVLMFQKKNNLVADGIVGRNTWLSLRS